MRAWVQATTIGDLVDRAAAESEGEAVVFPQQRVSYPELARLSDGFARSLRGLGVEPGDKVALLLPGDLDMVLALVGTAKLGAIPVPINSRFKALEVEQVVVHSDARVLVTATPAE